MAFNIVYNSNSPNTPTGKTALQTVAGLAGVGEYIIPVPYVGQPAPANNIDAASVIQSNGENIGNVVRKSNPLPPGLTS
jgi:hypothetical protein